MKKRGKELQRHLLTATSYMIPFLVAGGIIYSLAILLNGSTAFPADSLLYKLSVIGQAGLSMFIPVLGGYIAFSMADKPGLAPGFISAYLAKEIGAGFIGGILAGYISGFIMKQLKKIPVHEKYSIMKTVFLYPLAGTLLSGGIIVFIIDEPIAGLMEMMTTALNSISGMTKASLGIILGAMTGFDLGGPVNKVAYTFAQTQITTLPYLMGGIGCAGATPAIGSGIATILFKKKFNMAERESGKAAILLGCLGITEGAIPFALLDPVRMIPIYMVGSAVSCTTAFLLGCISHVPWGGLIALPLVEGRIQYFAAILLGSLVVAVLTGIFKKPSNEVNFDDIDVDDIDVDDYELNFDE